MKNFTALMAGLLLAVFAHAQCACDRDGPFKFYQVVYNKATKKDELHKTEYIQLCGKDFATAYDPYFFSKNLSCKEFPTIVLERKTALAATWIIKIGLELWVVTHADTESNKITVQRYNGTTFSLIESLTYINPEP